MRRGPRFPPRLLLGTLGLTAFVVMHGLTFPGGHLISGANPMVDAGTSVADERMVSTTPSSSGGGGEHGMSNSSHGDAAQACLAAVLAALAVIAAVVAVSRRPGTPHRRLPTMFAAPEPPVPRFAIAH
jgi:hypothetical protein